MELVLLANFHPLSRTEWVSLTTMTVSRVSAEDKRYQHDKQSETLKSAQNGIVTCVEQLQEKVIKTH